MSNHSNAPGHDDEAHTGPIKNPKQLLLAVFYSVVIPIFVIIGLVYYVTSANKPQAGSVNVEQSVVARIQKVGTVEIRDANREMKSGEAVYQAQCTACHTSGAAGAPKLGDTAAWATRIKTGEAAMILSVTNGKGAMPAKAGNAALSDADVKASVQYMVSSSK